MYEVKLLNTNTDFPHYWIVINKNGYEHKVCRIEPHYLESEGIANGIAKLLNIGKIKLDLSV